MEWNDTRADYPVDKCIHELFEEQVAHTPDALAIAFEDQQLSYGELNVRANQLAHYLRSSGVGANVLVGICVERSIEMVVGLLAIVKAGGAYVPLDPEYPTERLSFMLEDARFRAVDPTASDGEISITSITSSVFGYSVAVSVSVFRGEPWDGCTVTDLAYTIYTSGSTGTPKGVPIAHEALLNLVFWHQRTFEIVSSDRATQLAGTGFDAAVWEIWPYLTRGATLYLVKSELVTEPENPVTVVDR